MLLGLVDGRLAQTNSVTHLYCHVKPLHCRSSMEIQFPIIHLLEGFPLNVITGTAVLQQDS